MNFIISGLQDSEGERMDAATEDEYHSKKPPRTSLPGSNCLITHPLSVTFKAFPSRWIEMFERQPFGAQYEVPNLILSERLDC
jgi:hypothetical protein